ncbi:MAG: hypothetical protein A2Y89_05085 [Chloroflexi bacterium RBG_13_51_18]|nr:MAG: hypothetical protein A2Y89_05085 [Chloroflexi bacterium RBG_13_51_18]
MRQFIPVLMAGLALVLGGCTTTTDGDGNDVDTQAFYPNDEDNYWTYTVTSDPVEYEEDWTIIDDPGYQLCYSQQRMRSHVEGDPDDTNVETFFTDDETEAVIVEGYMPPTSNRADFTALPPAVGPTRRPRPRPG